MADWYKKKFRYSYAHVCLVALLIMIINLVLIPESLLYMSAVMVVMLDFWLFVGSITLVKREGMKRKNFYGDIFATLMTAGLFVCLLIRNYGDGIRMAGEIFIVIYDYVMAMFISCSIVGFLAVRHVPDFDKDFVIVLGCSISKQGGLLPLLRGRTNRAIKFAWQQEIATGKQAKYIPTGGQGKNEIMSEGSAMEMYLISHGAEEYEVIAEKQAANTWENMVFSKKIADSLLPGNKTAFVTTNYHVLRSGMIAKKAGLDAEGLASETKWYFWPNGFIREFIGILAMHKVQNIVALLLCIAAGISFVIF